MNGATEFQAMKVVVLSEFDRVSAELRGHVVDSLDKLIAVRLQLEANVSAVNARGDELNQSARELDERELLLTEREKAVGNVRQVAAQRKAAIEVLQRGQQELNAARIAAEGVARSEQKERTRLEGVCGQLLRDKAELNTALERAHGMLDTIRKRAHAVGRGLRAVVAGQG